jgi:YVTN family beta-propeller protein
MTTSADGKYAYFPWMIYRSNPINERNIRLGWVLASRIGRVRLDGASYREAISLDVPGLAMSDPHGIAINADQTRLVVAASGTHELLVYRLADLPFVGIGGPGDLIDQKLLRDRDLFYRIPLGGRPMGVSFAPDGKTAYVANYLQDAVQVVDVEAREVKRSIELGGPRELSLEREGAEIFYDGKQSLDQWYSCHSCHYNGGGSPKSMDTWNDGTPKTAKTVPLLYNVLQTQPWTWHGWQKSLPESLDNSFTVTMLGPGITPHQKKAVLAFFAELAPPPNPHLQADGSLSAAAERGKKIFAGAQANCTQCHSGEFFTDGEIHDVGLGSDKDHYRGFNTPSLLNCYAKVRYLHDGRARTLEDVLSKHHAPSKVSGTKDLSAEQLSDLVAYLKSL